MGESYFNNYVGKLLLDAQEFTVEVIAGSEFREVILGLPWLRNRRLVADFSAGVLKDVWKVEKYTNDPSPNLSPLRGEALKPPFPRREGG